MNHTRSIHYITRLKKLSVYYELSTAWDDALRDQNIWRLRDNSINKRLLSEDFLTFKRYMDLSLALESANNDVTKLNQPGEIHQINQRNQRSHRESRRIVLYIIIVLVLTASRVNQYQISKPELAIFRRTVKWCVTIVI